jgi:hypothetical protein
MNNRRDFIINTATMISGFPLNQIMKKFPFEYTGSAALKLEIYATNWGFEGSLAEFCELAKADGYDGIEVWAPQNEKDQKELLDQVSMHELKLGVLAGSSGRNAVEHLSSFKTYLASAIRLAPRFINCHAAKDFFTFEQNLPFIAESQSISARSNIPIYHETHRGRILYAGPIAEKFLDAVDDLRLTLDISHWCVVHESLLADQKDLVAKALSRTNHIHSRVGFAEAPQIPDPAAPQYESAVRAHFDWWDEVVRQKIKSGETLTMTTEFGPPPYMWTDPFTADPLSNQWEVNRAMMHTWRERYLNT